MACGFEWMAPRKTQTFFKDEPGLRLRRQIGLGVEKQVCILRSRHAGDHRSATDETTAMGKRAARA